MRVLGHPAAVAIALCLLSVALLAFGLVGVLRDDVGPDWDRLSAGKHSGYKIEVKGSPSYTCEIEPMGEDGDNDDPTLDLSEPEEPAEPVHATEGGDGDEGQDSAEETQQ